MKTLTATSTDRQITIAANNWLASKGYGKLINGRCVRGTFHFDNCGNYMLSARYILEQATGLEFTHFTASMARLKK